MYIIIIQARMGSTRLPGKVLKKLLDKEIVLWSYDRCKKSKANEVIIATSIEKNNDILEELFIKNNIKYFRGSENDLLDRYYQIANKYQYTNNINIIRVTSDCPFVDPNIINNMIDYYENNNYDYIINHSKNGIIPEGSGIEIINFKSLKYLWENEHDEKFREHATGMLTQCDKYTHILNIGYYNYLPKNIDIIKFYKIKISIDTQEEYEKSQKISQYFNNYDFSYDDLLLFYDSLFK